MSFVPNVYEEHEGNPWIERAAPILLVVGVALVIFFQQFLRQEHGATLVTPLPEVRAYEAAEEPSVGRLVNNARMMLKRHEFMQTIRASPTGDEVRKPLAQLDAIAISRVDRFRVAIVAADLLGPQEGVDRLLRLQSELDPDGPLNSEAAWVLKRYQQAAALAAFQQEQKTFDAAAREARAKKLKVPEKPAKLNLPAPLVEPFPEDLRPALVARHGFFGALALAQGPDRDEGYRRTLLGGFLRVVEFQDLLIAMQVLMALAGILILGIFLWRHFTGRDELGLHDPIAPTTVYLESFVLMLLGFTVCNAIGVLLLGNRSTTAIVIEELTMWLLPLCVFWPLARGVALKDAMTDLGIHRGAGIAKEVAIGIGGACAAIPLQAIIGVLIVAVRSAASGHAAESDEADVSAPGMYDTPEQATWAVMWFSTMGSILWAPFFEETIFRGALQRWLRVRVNWSIAVVICSLVFGFIHPYSLDGLVMVAASGIGFGLMREWRQCLIAPIVMHFMHNGFIALQQMGTLINLQ